MKLRIWASTSSNTIDRARTMSGHCKRKTRSVDEGTRKERSVKAAMLIKPRRVLAQIDRDAKSEGASRVYDAASCFEEPLLSSSSPLLPLSYLQLYSLDDFICFFFDTPPASTSLVPPFPHISLHRPHFESYSLLPSSPHLFISTQRVTMFVYKRGKSFSQLPSTRGY